VSEKRGIQTTDEGQPNEDFVLVQPGLFDYPLKEGEKPFLLAARCSKCNAVFFPARTRCRHCGANDVMEEVRLPGRGVVYASTVVHVDSPSGIKAPYAFGYVDVPAAGVRVFALFTGCDPALIRPGQEVELVIEPIRTSHEQKQVIGYKYKPVRERVSQ
jgi:uncharacterized OB-fold protein